MNAKLVKFALALGALALTTSSTTRIDALETQESQKLAQANSPQAIATTADVRIDGSSTVYPITQAIAKQFESEQKNKVSVNISGTSGGFEKFCAGQTDISNASRPILKAEIEACRKNSIRFIELPIAFDALTIVVHPQNNWAKDITIAELKKMWEPAAQGKITSWNQVRAGQIVL